MFKLNGLLLPLFLLLVSSSAHSPKFLVFGSSVREQRYNRPDILRHFKSYNGYYDIRNKHYWTSAAFTGIHGYAIAGIWILGGLGFGIFMIGKNLNSSSSPVTDYSDSYYFIAFLVIVLFTLLAIVATGLVLAANRSTVRRSNKLKETLLGAFGDARRSIRRVMVAMRDVRHLLCPYDPTTCLQLNSTSHSLAKEMQIIRRVVHKSRHSFDLVIQASYLATVVVVALNMVSVVAALVLLLLHWRPGLVMVIFICWILTALCWLLTGFHFVLYTFAEDTCSALEEFEQNPGKNSLRAMIPCLEPAYGDQIMVGIGFAIHNFITELNSKIEKYSKLIRMDEQSDDLLRGFWKICDPFPDAPNYSYKPGKCPNNTIPIGEIPDILERFTCYRGTSSEACKKGWRDFLSEATIEMAWSFTHSIQDLINVLPDLQNLLQCSFVKDTFKDIVLHQCRPFRSSTRFLWASMLSLSTLMVILVLAWVAKAYLDKGKCFSRCSLKPSSVQED